MAKSSAKYFEVRWRTQGADEAWSAPQRIDPSKEVVVEGLDRTKSYDFEVRAVSNCGAMSIWVPSDYTVPTVPPLPAVNIPVGSSVADGVQLDWGDGTSTRADLQYEISRAPATGNFVDTPPPDGHASWKRVAMVSGTTWVDALTDTAHYWYRIRTVDYRGNVGEWSIISTPQAASISTGELAASVLADLAELGDEADQLRDDVDTTIAQVQVLQGQVGDILQADEWVNTTAYPSGDLVQSGGKLYRAKQAVPAGTPVTNTAYWELIGNYASLGEAVSATAANVTVNTNKIAQNTNDITATSQTLDTVTSTVSGHTTTLTSYGTRISTAETKIDQNGTAIDAVASDVALLGASNAGKTAFNLNSGTVKIDGDQTLAQTLAGLQAVDVGLSARVDSEELARVAGDSANASSIDAVQATLGNDYVVLDDPSFESVPITAWSTTNGLGTTNQPHTGKRCGRFVANGTTQSTETTKTYPVVAGETLRLRAYFRPTGGPPDGDIRFVVRTYDASGALMAFVGTGSLTFGDTSGTGVYVPYSSDYVIPSGVASVRVGLQARNLTVNTWAFDDFSALRMSGTLGETAQVVQSMIANVGPGGAYAQATMMLDVNGYSTGWRQTNNGITSSAIFVTDTFGVVSPSGSDALTWASGVLTATKSGNAVKLGAGFGSDTDKLILYFGAAGADASRTLAGAKVGITAAGRYKFGSTWGGLISGWSSGGAISYTSTATSATISVASGVFRVGDQSISYNASSVSFNNPSGGTRTYYLYYDDPGMTGGSLTLNADTNPVRQYDGDGRVVIGQLAVTFKSGGGGGSNPVCPARNAYVWRRRGTEIRWVRAKRVRPGDWLRVIDPATGDLRWGLVTYSRSVLTECVTVATDAGVALTCSRTAPLGTPDGEVLSIDAEGRTVSGYAGGFVTPKVTAVTATGRQWVQHITCENTFFLAGDKPGEGLAHHNLKPIRDL